MRAVSYNFILFAQTNPKCNCNQVQKIIGIFGIPKNRNTASGYLKPVHFEHIFSIFQYSFRAQSRKRQIEMQFTMKILFVAVFGNVFIVTLAEKSAAMYKPSLEVIQDILRYLNPNTVRIIMEREKNEIHTEFLEFLNSIQWNFSITTETISNSSFENTEQMYKSVSIYLLSDNENGTIDRFVTLINKRKKKKSLNTSVIIFQRIISNNSNWLRDLFTKLWSKNILKIFVLFYRQHLNIYTFDPFDESGLTVINATGSSNFKDIVLIKRLKNLKGYKIPVGLFHLEDRALKYIDSKGKLKFSGIDGFTADLIGERMNASLEYHLIDSADSQKNNIEMLNGNVSLSFNIYGYYKKSFENHVETTKAFQQKNFCALVPKAGYQPAFKNVFFSLSMASWIIVLVNLLLFPWIYQLFQTLYSFVMVVLLKKEDTDESLTFSSSIKQNYLFTIQTFVGEPLNIMPNKAVFLCLMLSWIIYGFLVTSGFTAKLLSSLVSPRPLADINTIDELFNSSLRINSHANLYGNFRAYMHQDIWNVFQERVINITWNSLGTRLAVNYTDDAYIQGEFFAYYYKYKFYNKIDNRPYFHIMEDRVLYFPAVYLVEQGSPFLEFMDKLLGWFYQYGFILKWDEMALSHNILQGHNNERIISEDDSDSRVILTMEHFQTIFYIWVIGTILGMVCFLYEYWQECVKIRFRNNRVGVM